MSRAVLSLGANLGDRAAALRTAIAALKDDCGLGASTTVQDTTPRCGVEQPPNLKTVVTLRGRRCSANFLDYPHVQKKTAPCLLA